jgi:opacity protein-like surface antigen
MSTATLCGTLTPFVEAGVGGLVFAPTDAPGASTTGAGADFNVTKRVFVRAEYRGLVYNSPTFDLTPAVGTDRVSQRAEVWLQILTCESAMDA